MSFDKRVLVIGGAGYVGSVICWHLLDHGYAVTSFDRVVYRHEHAVWPLLSRAGFRFVNGDMGSPADLERALDGVQYVVLLAGLVGDPITKKYPVESEAINLRGIQQALKALAGKGVERVLFASTCSNYGLIPDKIAAAEDYELKPLSLYARHKVAIERELLAQKDKVDYSATVLRFATAFGLSSRMRFDLTVSEFTRELALGRELLVFDAHTWRPYCHVQDLSAAVRMTLEVPMEKVHYEVFNVGGDANNLTKQMIVDEILRQVPTGKVKFQEHGADPRNYRVSFEKIERQLGFHVQYTVQRGVEELLSALREGLFHRAEDHRYLFGNYELFLEKQ
ncbi:MAG TPA: NAD(P)-dependent oxidoreductase [Vicinamibacterales bacterium]|nr:NAD(P)-dependent oxidoreductase [Vicinamibacterales bacterium]